jgi:hypothetical protein
METLFLKSTLRAQTFEFSENTPMNISARCARRFLIPTVNTRTHIKNTSAQRN